MNRIKHCREKSNLSQKYVAVALGVAAPSVSNWERGKTKWRYLTPRECFKLMGFDESDFDRR